MHFGNFGNIGNFGFVKITFFDGFFVVRQTFTKITLQLLFNALSDRVGPKMFWRIVLKNQGKKCVKFIWPTLSERASKNSFIVILVKVCRTTKNPCKINFKHRNYRYRIYKNTIWNFFLKISSNINIWFFNLDIRNQR